MSHPSFRITISIVISSGAPVEDITQYVSLCAMCSHNEGAVRWSRFVDKGLLYYRNFYIRYYCTDVSGEQVIPEEVINVTFLCV